MDGRGLDCSESLRVKLISWAWAVVWVWLMYSWFHVLLCVIPFATWAISGGWYMSPDLTIFNDGIETKRLGIKQFIAWKDINYVSLHSLGCNIGHRKIPFAMKVFLLFNPPIRLTKWRNNYKEAIKIIMENTKHE